MTDFLLNEPLVTALRARLASDLAAQIAVVNARVTDGFTISAPGTILDYVPSADEAAGMSGTGTVLGIGDLPATFEDDTGFSVTGRHALNIVAFAFNADQRALAWQLRRYTQAITTVALATRRLGDAWGVGLGRVIPGPTLDVTESPRTWMSWSGVEIRAQRSEE